MTNSLRIFLWALTAALGGFLFGFDTAVISGVEQTIQGIWHLNSLEHGFTISIALIGTVFGSILGVYPAEIYGRKNTLLFIAILYLVSSLGTGFAPNWLYFLIFRFLGGLGIGISSVVAPMFISEISPSKSRGRLVAMFQFNIVFGILCAYLSNYVLAGFEGENDWRYMLGIQAIPSVLFLISLLFIPESPRWLILKRNDSESARRILNLIEPENTEAILLSISQNRLNTKKSKLFQRIYFKPISFAFLIAFFNQVSGINAIIYFAPRIFEIAGIGKNAALLSSAGIGLVNLFSTLVGISFIDRFGRRFLMIIGSIGLIITLSLVSLSFYQFQLWISIPVILFLYIGFFGFSQGAVIWVFISEIFPNEVRASGQALGSFTHWIMATIIAFVFPYVVEVFGPGNVFAFFSIMMCLQLLYALVWMPETKGKILEEIDKPLIIH